MRRRAARPAAGPSAAAHRQTAGSPAARLFATFENKVLHAVYDAFYSALQICLVLSASVVMVSGVVAFVALRNEKTKYPRTHV